MAEPIPFHLALPVILGIIVILGLAELAVFYLVSTRTPDRFLRAVAPVAVILLGISSQMNYNAENVAATSALVGGPLAAFIPPFLFRFAGPETGIKRIVACYLVVSLFAAGFTFYFVMGSLSMVPWIYSLTPISNGVVFLVGVAVDLLLAAGVYTGMERTGVLGER